MEGSNSRSKSRSNGRSSRNKKKNQKLRKKIQINLKGRNIHSKLEKMKRKLPKSQEVYLGPKSPNKNLLEANDQPNSSIDNDSYKIRNVEDQIVDILSQIQRVVQKGGNMYLEKFESFDERKSSKSSKKLF